MSKIKEWAVSVLDKKRVMQTQDSNFYTSDTDASIIFELTDSGFNPTEATVTIYNREDKSLVSEEVVVEDNKFNFPLVTEVRNIIEHSGPWLVRALYIVDGKKYTSQSVGFYVEQDLEQHGVEKLEIIQNWERIQLQADSLMAEMDESLIGFQTKLDEVIANEAERKTAEEQRRVEFANMQTEIDGFDQELVNARQGEASLGKNLHDMKDKQQNDKNDSDVKSAVNSRGISQLGNTLSMVNINQEAKQTVEGADVISLPKNAGEGAGVVGLEGLTVTNLVENGDFRDGSGNITEFRGVSTSVSNKTLTMTKTSDVTVNRLALKNAGQLVKDDKYYMKYMILSQKLGTTNISFGGLGFNNHSDINETDTWVNVSFISEGQRDLGNMGMYIHAPFSSLVIGEHIKFKNIQLINLTQTFGAGNELSKEWCDAHLADYIDGTKSVAMPKRIKSGNSQLYLNTPHELRSLPNGISDEIRPDGKGGYELVKRVSDSGTKLSEPVVSSVSTSGNLTTYPSGTVYFENVITDAGMYTDKFTTLYSYPIQDIESLNKLSADGTEVKLDVSKVVISGNTFTHPDLTKDDIVFVEYYYESEQPTGNNSVEHYDSRYTIKDSVNGKFYQWNITSTNGVADIGLEEV